MLLSHTWARLLCNILAYLYPAYATFKAVKASDRSVHAQWLTYWIVNSYFTVAEIIGDNVLSGVPLYYEIKVALLIWLVLPRFHGAEKIYTQVIQPYLMKYEDDIDNSIKQLQEQGAHGLGVLKQAGVNQMKMAGAPYQQAVLNSLLSAAAAGIPSNQPLSNQGKDAPEVD